MFLNLTRFGYAEARTWWSLPCIYEFVYFQSSWPSLPWLHPHECKDLGALLLPVVTPLFSSGSGNSVHFRRDEGTREWSDSVLDAKGRTCPGLSVSWQLCHVSCALVPPVVPSFHWTLKLPHERVWSSSPYRVQKGMGLGWKHPLYPGVCQNKQGYDCLQQVKKKKGGDLLNSRFPGTFESHYNLRSEEGWASLGLDARVPS